MSGKTNLNTLLALAVMEFKEADAKYRKVYGNKRPEQDPRYEGLNDCRKNVVRANAKPNKVTYCLTTY